jgi:hypothetical protein
MVPVREEYSVKTMMTRGQFARGTMLDQKGGNMIQMMNQPLPKDLQGYLDNGTLHETAVRKIARRRHVEEVLWGLADQAGITDQLEAMLA